MFKTVTFDRKTSYTISIYIMCSEAIAFINLSINCYRIENFLEELKIHWCENYERSIDLIEQIISQIFEQFQFKSNDLHCQSKVFRKTKRLHRTVLKIEYAIQYFISTPNRIFKTRIETLLDCALTYLRKFKTYVDQKVEESYTLCLQDHPNGRHN